MLEPRHPLSCVQRELRKRRPISLGAGDRRPELGQGGTTRAIHPRMETGGRAPWRTGARLRQAHVRRAVIFGTCAFSRDMGLQCDVLPPSKVTRKTICELIGHPSLLYLRRQTLRAPAVSLLRHFHPPGTEVSVMKTWTRTIIVGAALLAGCEGSIGTGAELRIGGQLRQRHRWQRGDGQHGRDGYRGQRNGRDHRHSPGRSDGVHAGHPADVAAPAPDARRIRQHDARSARARRAAVDDARAGHARQRRSARVGRLQGGRGCAGDAGHGQRHGARPRCSPARTDNATLHAQQFITTFGQKAFRRPLTRGRGRALPDPVHEPRDDHARAARSIRRCS